MNERPRGLTVLAVVQFILCLCVLSASRVTGIMGFITGILMAISAIGYFKLDYKLGFVGGNILGIFYLFNIVIFNLIQGFSNFNFYIPSLVYSIVLLILLNNKYKNAFVINA